VSEILLQDTNPLRSAKFITVVWIRHQILWLLITIGEVVCGRTQMQSAVEKCQQFSVQILTFVANGEFFFLFLQQINCVG